MKSSKLEFEIDQLTIEGTADLDIDAVREGIYQSLKSSQVLPNHSKTLKDRQITLDINQMSIGRR